MGNNKVKNMENKITELELIESTKEELSSYGKVEVLYATSGAFDPSSNMKPDLKFIPKCSKSIYFIEFKHKPKFGFNIGDMNLIVEHRDFFIEGQNIDLRYAFATDYDLEETLVNVLEQNQIMVFKSIEKKEDLIEDILIWTKG
jgi:hypothetical protein